MVLTKQENMISTEHPDFIVDCYMDLDVADRPQNTRFGIFEKSNLGYFFISVKDPVAVNTERIVNGDTEKINVSVMCNIESLFEGEVTLSDDSFILRKDVALQNGEAYVIEYMGKRVGERRSYVGTYCAFNKETGKPFPFFSGNFHMSAEHFFNKYGTNSSITK